MELASLAAFIFLCVAFYGWLSVQLKRSLRQFGVAGIFVAVAAIGAIIFALACRRVRERAIIEGAARANSPPWLLDPTGNASCLWPALATEWTREHSEGCYSDTVKKRPRDVVVEPL